MFGFNLRRGEQRKPELFVIFLCSILTSTAVLPISGNAGTLTSQTPQNNSIYTIEKTYQFSAPTLSTINGRDHITMGSLEQWSMPGEPCVPAQPLNILLPNHYSLGTVTVTCKNPIIIPGSYNLENGQTPVRIGSIDPVQTTQPNQTIYKSETPYPAQTYDVIGVQHFRGYRVLEMNVFPVQYIPAKKIISYTPEMTITITTDLDENNGTPDPMYRGSFEDEDALLQKGIVSDALGTYASIIEPNGLRSYDLMIITSPGLKIHFQRLADAHMKQGLRTTIRTIGEDIRYSADVSELRENIRNYIRFAYQNWNIEYVLLGGDSDIIPPAFLLNEYPSDNYYACLDGTYDGNKDGRWGSWNDGENGGDVDLLAEVYIGRACVNTKAEVNFFINKTLAYMNTKLDKPVLSKVLMVGEHLYPGEGSYYMEQLIDRCSLDSYVTTGIPSSNYHIEKLYDEDWPDPFGWPKQEMIQRLNSETHIVNHMGHSGDWWNMKLEIPDVDNLTNQFPFFVYSEGCDSGAFDNPYGYDCIAEHFTVKTNHAAFAGVWNTRSGWIGDSQHQHRQFWDAVFTENISTLGAANQDSKEDNLWQIGRPKIRDCYFEATLFGDPTISFLNRPLHANAHGPYHGLVNDAIQFHGSVYGVKTPLRWLWNFGDGTTSTIKNPLHLYQRNGVYTVTLTIVEPTGTRAIDVTNATIVLGVYIQAPMQGIKDEPVQFNGTVAGGFPPYTWSWDFGDHTGKSTEQNTSYTYHRIGTYTVSLWVNDSRGNSERRQTTIQIVPQTVWVDDDNVMPPWDGTEAEPFPSIQMGLDTVVDGGIVWVEDGMYIENINIHKSVQLLAFDRDSTFIVGGMRNTNDMVTMVGVSQVNMSGFTIIPNVHSTGSFYIVYSQNVNIDNIIISPGQGVRPAHGMLIVSSSNVTVSHTVIQTNGYGIELQYASNNTIKENRIMNNYYGMKLTGCSNNTIYHNDFMMNLHRPIDDGSNIWYRPYPIGGNYWSDFDDTWEGAHDDFSGPQQDVTGSDYIVDMGLPNGGLNPYTISGAGQNKDWFPFIMMNGWWSH